MKGRPARVEPVGRVWQAQLTLRRLFWCSLFLINLACLACLALCPGLTALCYFSTGRRFLKVGRGFDTRDRAPCGFFSSVPGRSCLSRSGRTGGVCWAANLQVNTEWAGHVCHRQGAGEPPPLWKPFNPVTLFSYGVVGKHWTPFCGVFFVPVVAETTSETRSELSTLCFLLGPHWTNTETKTKT